MTRKVGLPQRCTSLSHKPDWYASERAGQRCAIRGLQIADSTFNGVGFVNVDDFNNVEFYLRGLDFEQTGGFLEITFNGNDLITDDDVTQEQIDGLYAVTDLMFSGGQIFVMELINEGGLLEWYNPCNQYKGFMLF